MFTSNTLLNSNEISLRHFTFTLSQLSWRQNSLLCCSSKTCLHDNAKYNDIWSWEPQTATASVLSVTVRSLTKVRAKTDCVTLQHIAYKTPSCYKKVSLPKFYNTLIVNRCAIKISKQLKAFLASLIHKPISWSLSVLALEHCGTHRWVPAVIFYIMPFLLSHISQTILNASCSLNISFLYTHYPSCRRQY